MHCGVDSLSNERVNKLIQVIRKISLFDGLGPTQMQKVLGAWRRGKSCTLPTQPGDEMYILLSGEAVMYALDDSEIARIQPVATIGELSIVTKQPRTSAVKAMQASNVLVFKRLALDMAPKTDADAQAKILRNVVEILAGKMNDDTERMREYLKEVLISQDAVSQLQKRVDLALSLLAKETGTDMDTAKARIDEQLSSSMMRNPYDALFETFSLATMLSSLRRWKPNQIW